MAASISTTMACFLLLALVVVSAGSRQVPGVDLHAADEAPAPGLGLHVADEAPAPGVGLDEADAAPAPGVGRHAADEARAPGVELDEADVASAPEEGLDEADAAAGPGVGLDEADDNVVLLRPLPTTARRCDSDMRWTDALCRNVCGLYKFYGYEFSAPVSDAGEASTCCCCPGGATCVPL